MKKRFVACMTTAILMGAFASTAHAQNLRQTERSIMNILSRSHTCHDADTDLRTRSRIEFSGDEIEHQTRMTAPGANGSTESMTFNYAFDPADIDEVRIYASEDYNQVALIFDCQSGSCITSSLVMNMGGRTETDNDPAYETQGAWCNNAFDEDTQIELGSDLERWFELQDMVVKVKFPWIPEDTEEE